MEPRQPRSAPRGPSQQDEQGKSSECAQDNQDLGGALQGVARPIRRIEKSNDRHGLLRTHSLRLLASICRGLAS